MTTSETALTQLRLREIATLQVKGVAPETPLKEAAQLLAKAQITGLLVVTNDSGPVGVLTQTDIVRVAGAQAEGLVARLAGTLPGTVEDAMSPVVVSFDMDDRVVEVARLMARDGLHRVFVTEDGVLSGVVSLMDIARAVGELTSG